MLERLATRIASRRRLTLGLAVTFVLVAGVVGGPVAGELRDSGGFISPDSDSQRASDRVERATGSDAGPGILMLVSTPSGLDAARGHLRGLQERLAKVPGIASTASGAESPALVASDGSSALVTGTLKAGADDVDGAVSNRFGDLDDVELGGSEIADTQVGDRVGADLGRAEALAFPILVILALLIFRRRAALLPLIVGVTTVLGAFLALRLINQAYGLSVFALNLVIGLGLGLAIDYTLFLVTRYREELASGADPDLALRRTFATAGRTVAFSAVTVAVALITLTLFPLNFLRSMGIAGATVALIAAMASLTLTPALFSAWGTKLALPSAPSRREEEGGWYRLSHAVMRHPGVIAVATTAVMLLAASPALRSQFTPVDASVIPKSESSRTVADALGREYPETQASPIDVVVEAPPSAAGELRSYASALGGIDGVVYSTPPRPLGDRTWQIALTVDGEPDGPLARDIVGEIRSRASPYPLLVGGDAAEFVDQQDSISERLPLAMALVALLTMTVLWAMTGSVVLAVKAIVMNVLTVGAALGAITLVYQDGRFESLLSYTSNGGVEPTDFLVAAALVFALSTDYGVFLLGRIKEARDSGLPDREAVAIGLQRTGRVVTCAAILLAVAIGAFATSSISFIQQVGVATAFAVLLDAFVVRALLVPSLMALLGKWNWWSPAWLRRLHRPLEVRA